MAHSAVLMCQRITDGNALKRRLSDCEISLNVNTRTAACDLSGHQDGGASRFEVQFIPTFEPHRRESGLQKSGGLPVRVTKAYTWAREPTRASTRQRLLTIDFQQIRTIRKTPPRLNLGCFFKSWPSILIVLVPLSGPCEQKLCFEHACWHPALWRVVAFTQPSPGWQSKALQAGKPISPPVPSFPRSPHRRSLACLFTICRGVLLCDQ